MVPSEVKITRQVMKCLLFCIILYVFLFTNNVAWVLSGTTINRTMLLIILLLTFSAGLLVVGKDDADPEESGGPA